MNRKQKASVKFSVVIFKSLQPERVKKMKKIKKEMRKLNEKKNQKLRLCLQNIFIFNCWPVLFAKRTFSKVLHYFYFFTFRQCVLSLNLLLQMCVNTLNSFFQFTLKASISLSGRFFCFVLFCIVCSCNVGPYREEMLLKLPFGYIAGFVISMFVYVLLIVCLHLLS